MNHPEPSRLLSLFLAPVAGVVLWAAFPDVAFWPAAFVAVALLWAALRRDGAWWNVLVGLLFGLAFFAPHISWALQSTALVPWIALSITEAAFLAAFGAGWTWARRAVRRWCPTTGFRGLLAEAGAFALVFTAAEQARSELPFGGFPWGRLAWSMVDAPLGRAAWLGGTVLVTFLVVGVAVLLARVALALWADRAALRRREQGWRALLGPLGAVVLAAVLVAGPLALPLPRSHEPGTVTTADGLEVQDAGMDAAEQGVLFAGAVQGNVGEPGLGAFANRAEVLNNHLDGTFELADEFAGDLDVVLWPENGSDLDPQTNRDVATALDRAARAVDAPLLVGAQEWPDTGGRYNVSLLWQDGEGVTQRYAKQHPAPFGEYIPMRSFARLFTDQVDRVRTDMIPGDEPAVIDLPTRDHGDVRLATIICFEVAYDEIVRDAVRRGAQVIVVQTNNASFGFSPESTQQLQMSRMQAIANGRATVQISTVGVSGVITPDGTLVHSTDLFTHDTFVAALPLRTTLTPAAAAGYWPGWVVSGLGGLLVAAGVVAGVLRRRRSARDEAGADSTTAGTLAGAGRP